MGTVTAPAAIVTPPPASVAQVHAPGTILLDGGAQQAKEAPKLVQLIRAGQGHLQEVAEQRGKPQIHLLRKTIETLVDRIVAEQRGHAQLRRALSYFVHEGGRCDSVEPARNTPGPSSPAAGGRDALGVPGSTCSTQKLRNAPEPRGPGSQAGLDLAMLWDVHAVPALPQRNLRRKTALQGNWKP
jgi:hypothetical protein